VRVRACTQLLPKPAYLFAGQADGASRKEELAEQIETNSLSSFLIVGFRFRLRSDLVVSLNNARMQELSRPAPKQDYNSFEKWYVLSENHPHH
jgi:hypothetical protein